MSQQYTSPQANERVATGETYEMSQPQEPNSPQPGNGFSSRADGR